MGNRLSVLFMVVFVLSFYGFAAEPHYKSALGSASEEIIFTDVDKDGDPDILEKWWNGKRCRWIDENDDMSPVDKLGDIVSDCLQVDMDGDGRYDGPTDMCVKWVDNDRDGQADFQVIVINPKAGEEKKFGGAAHYMVFEDNDNDGVLGYLNWETFGFPCWNHTGRCNFSPDYNGDSIFLKAHMAPFALSDARLNWENPFAFYDTDDDGCTEMSVRYVDNPGCDAKADAVFVAYDIDNDTQRDNEMDYDFSLHFAKNAGLEYRHYSNPCPDLKAADWVLPFFQQTEWRVIDELIYVPHDKCYDEVFKQNWDKCYFVFDEDDDDHRWERVELYYPNDPYALRTKNSYAAKRDGKTTPTNIHPQSDSLGDRGEFDADNSGKGKLYISRWDGRIHLYGAEWGMWAIDSEAQYNGAAALPNVCSREIAKELESVVMYHDTDGNGFFDLIEFDDNADKVPDLTVSLLEYGSDECDLLDPAKAGWQGIHEAFKQSAKQSWSQGYGLYRVFWRKGLSSKRIDDLSFASSTWEKYFHGTKLKEAIFRELSGKLKGDPGNLRLLRKYYFTADFDAMKQWMLTLDFNKAVDASQVFTLENTLSIARNDELVSIPLEELRGIDIDSFVVSREGAVLASQVDDIDFDGIADAILFLVDMKPNEKFQITVNHTDKPVSYPKRTHAEISIVTDRKEAVGTGLGVDGGTFKSKKCLFRKPGNISASYRYEGPLIESDKVAYRLYWDHRGAIDVFGKTSEQFVGDAHNHKVSHHTIQPWGRDLLHNGSALGVGGLGIGSDDKRFSPGRANYAKIIIGTDGPVKSSYRMVYDGFEYQGKTYSLTWDISISAGQRYLTHTVNVTSGGVLPMMAVLTNHADEHEVAEIHHLGGSGLNWFAGYGDQVFADLNPQKAAGSDEKMGMALIWNRCDVQNAQETDQEYRAVFKPAKDIQYYSLVAYNKEFGDYAVQNERQLNAYLNDLALKLATPVLVK